MTNINAICSCLLYQERADLYAKRGFEVEALMLIYMHIYAYVYYIYVYIYIHMYTHTHTHMYTHHTYRPLLPNQERADLYAKRGFEVEALTLLRDKGSNTGGELRINPLERSSTMPRDPSVTSASRYRRICVCV